MNEEAQNKSAPEREVAVNAASQGKRSMRVFTIVAVVFTLIVGTAGWAWINREHEPEIIVMGTGPFGSDAYNLMKEVSQVVQRHSDSLRIEVRPTRDASQNIALLNTDAIDAAVIRSDTPVVADIRGITNLYPDIFQIIVRDDVPAYRVGNLADVRVSVPEFGSDGFRSFWVIGDHYDLPIDSMIWKAELFERGAARLLAGDVDALFTVRSLRDAPLIRMFEEAQLKRIKLRFIAIDQAESIALKRPFLSSATIPKGAFTGAAPVPRAKIPTSSVDRLLVTREDVSDSAVRELTRIMFENRLDLTIRFALASAIEAPPDIGGLAVPIHDGAQSFYDRDEPSYIQENAEPIALGLTVIAGLFSGLLALRSRYVSSQKNKADIYNYKLLDIQKKAILTDKVDELDDLKVEANNVLQDVVIALDTDEVTDEGFQSFSLLWDAVRETINDRIRQVQR